LDKSSNNEFLLQKFFTYLTHLINNQTNNTESELKAVTATHILGTLLGNVSDNDLKIMIKKNF